MIEFTIKGKTFICCNPPPSDPYRCKENNRDCCYHPGCTKTPFADFAALFSSSYELLNGGDTSLVIYTCKEHNNLEFQIAKDLLLKFSNEKYRQPCVIICTRDQLHSHARGILGDGARRMSRGIDTAF